MLLMMMIWFWFWFLMSFITKASSENNYLQFRCLNTTSSSYTPNSTYKANLDILLSNLYSNTTQKNGFYSTTVAAVHGLFLCRGDISTDECGTCVVVAGKRISELCSNGKTGMIWYDECTLRYSEKSMSGILDQSTSFTGISPENQTKPGYMQFVETMFDQIITLASNGYSEKKFAVSQAHFSAYDTVYGLVQCTPDLSKIDCQKCLRNATSMLPNCCSGAKGGRAVFPSCNVRYEFFTFYNLSALAAQPPLAPPTTHSPPPQITLPNSTTTKGKFAGNKGKVIVASIVTVTGILLCFLCLCFLKNRVAKKYLSMKSAIITGMSEIPTEDSVQYDFTTIQAITNFFSPDNMIGEGGYGVVYKGRLSNGQEVAVKRLSGSSSQGAVEFKNEVALIAKLQHRNLVKLMGFCLEREEKILIYEFVPNKSLDYFLFDPEKKQLLNWPTRYKIIGGIARGLLYLHQDSHLKIIHRDMKASNVLLDEDMNSKISDFGLARILMVDETQGNTSRVIGTYGYMSPEYVMHGLFSVKSDVYSFGVLLLEIITGKKNSFFSKQSTGPQDLISYAWKHWREDTPVDMVDQSLGGLYCRNEVIQCIHVGLLCVQEVVDERPTMANVVLMLNSNSATRRAPNPLTIFDGGSETKTIEADQSRSKSLPLSENEASITELYPR